MRSLNACQAVTLLAVFYADIVPLSLPRAIHSFGWKRI